MDFQNIYDESKHNRQLALERAKANGGFALYTRENGSSKKTADEIIKCEFIQTDGQDLIQIDYNGFETLLLTNFTYLETKEYGGTDVILTCRNDPAYGWLYSIVSGNPKTGYKTAAENTTTDIIAGITDKIKQQEKHHEPVHAHYSPT